MSRKTTKRVKIAVIEPECDDQPSQKSALQQHGFISTVDFVASLDSKQFAVLTAMLDGYYRGGIRDAAEFNIIAAEAAALFDSLTA